MASFSFEPPPTRLKLGIALALLAYLFFASAASLVWRFGREIPTFQIVFIQNAVCFLCILPFAIFHGKHYLKTREIGLHLVRDVFGVVSYFFFFLAIRYLNLVDATTLNYTTPFFVPLIWRFWRHEKIYAHVWWAIVIGFLGIAVILNPTREIFRLGFVYGIFAGVSSAMALAGLRVLNLKMEPTCRTLFYYFSIGSALSFPFAWASWKPLDASDWIVAVGIGIATVAGQLLLTAAYRYGTAAYLSPLAYSAVIYNALIAYAVFDQRLGWHSLVGTALVIIGGTLTYLLKKHPSTILQAFKHSDANKQPPL